MNLSSLQRIKSRIAQHGDFQSIDQLCLDNIPIKIFNSQITQYIQKCTNVQYLMLNDCGISSLQNFPRLSKLVALQLVQNSISDTQIKHLVNCRNLRQIALNQNLIQNFQSLKVLAGLKKLQQLQLMGNPISQQHKYHSLVFQKIPTLQLVDSTDKFGNMVEQDSFVKDLQNFEDQSQNKNIQISLHAESQNLEESDLQVDQQAEECGAGVIPKKKRKQ